ncbi:MAG TPA: hypothetical protein VG675_17900 [Bryobacteraceae bacterium]|nr:hypothetical protein [Bryobacteraceae bacterium]
MAELVHDLRQPLSTIENSVYYLKILLGSGPADALEQLRLIEQQINCAARSLAAAARVLGTGRPHSTGAIDSLDLTKPETAGVT